MTTRQKIVHYMATKVRMTKSTDIAATCEEIASELYREGHAWDEEMENMNWKRLVSDVKNYNPYK